MNIIEQTLTDVLKSREDRVAYQKQLLEQYKVSLISFKLNIPGKVKDSELYRKIFREGLQELMKVFQNEGIQVNFRNDLYKQTGPESYIVLAKCPNDIKKITTYVEDYHSLGRIFDFDVLDPTGKPISRVDLGVKPRKCFLCEEDAFECGRLRRHTVQEMTDWITKIATTYFEHP